MNDGRDLTGTVVSNQFRLDERLDAGGMGAVYRVTELTTRRARALKLLHAEVALNPKAVALFEREVRIGSAIGSKHFVDVLGAGYDAVLGAPWVLMELLEGESLARRLARDDGRLRPEELLPLCEQLGAALEAAHAAGIIHRDLKPGNLFLARSGLQGVPGPVLKVIDFGLAKAISSGDLTDLTTLGGTPEYMAPEQAGAASITVRADVWPLGLIAYRALTGKMFWRASQQRLPPQKALLKETLVDPIPRASVRALEQGVQPYLPARFDGWFARCVDRDPGARFEDGGVAARELCALLAPAPAPVPQPMTRGMPSPPRVPTLPSTEDMTRLVEAMKHAQLRGSLPEAIAFGEQALAVAPDAAGLRPQMATLFARRAERLLGAGLQDLASGDLERALTLDPDCVAAWKARARWWESLGRWDDAVNDGSEALSRNPTDADALEARARAWDALGRTACAAADRALVARIEQQSTWSASPRVSQESPR